MLQPHNMNLPPNIDGNSNESIFPSFLDSATSHSEQRQRQQTQRQTGRYTHTPHSLGAGAGSGMQTHSGMDWEPTTTAAAAGVKRQRTDSENNMSGLSNWVPATTTTTTSTNSLWTATGGSRSGGESARFGRGFAKFSSSSAGAASERGDRQDHEDTEMKDDGDGRNIMFDGKNADGDGDADVDVSMISISHPGENDEHDEHRNGEDVGEERRKQEQQAAAEKERPISLGALNRVLNFRQSRQTPAPVLEDKNEDSDANKRRNNDALILSERHGEGEQDRDGGSGGGSGGWGREDEEEEEERIKGHPLSSSKFNLGAPSAPSSSNLRHRSSTSSSHQNVIHGNSYTLNLHGHGRESGRNGLVRRRSGEGQDPANVDVRRSSGMNLRTHSELPYILLGYLQFIFNASVAFLALYLIFAFLLTIRQDVSHRMKQHSNEILQEIATCTNLYLINRCEPGERIPAMESACLDWEQCMSRSPLTHVGHAKVGAEILAGVVSGFVDELSWKTIFFILTTMTCLVFITNSALFNLRNKHAQQHAMSQQQQQQQQGQYIAQGQQGQREREQERQERQELERERERRRLWRQQLPSSAGPGPDHRHSNSLEPEEEDEHEDDRRFLGVGEGRRDSTIGESGRKEGNQQSKFLFEWPPRR